ncbi:stAR-related lipid transfer protein 3-like [Rhopilema esculentum]|uniref:stAR-related lipid transfer protein 3-like n=1 Tax=Rhopilema esculentum TaxID=499914 RepID=UPI0031D58C83
MKNNWEQQPLLGPHSASTAMRSPNDAFVKDLTRSLEDIKRSLDRENIGNDEKFGLSPVRRMFCLLSFFDFLLIVLLWIIYAQTTMDSLTKMFNKEVEEYKFKSSLFDFVVLAFVRCILLLFTYALLKSSKWYSVAVTTMLSTLMAILKVVMNEGTVIKSGQPMSYLIVIATFVICWSEAWHFDFQVIPTELRLRRENIANTLTASIPTLPSTVSDWRLGANSEYQSCYSPGGRSPKESGDSDSDTVSNFSRDDFNRNSKQGRHINRGKEAVKQVQKMLHITENWKKEKEDNGILVEARHFDGIGKVFRCKSLLACHSSLLFNILWNNVESQPSWNPTVSDCQIISVINKKTDICYVVAAEAAGGLVSSRDFVSVRRYEKQGGLFVLAGESTTCDTVPARKNIVRGENGPGGYIIKVIPNEADRCEFIWFLNTDIKGWIPKSVIDQTMASVMIDTVRALQDHIERMPKL